MGSGYGGLRAGTGQVKTKTKKRENKKTKKPKTLRKKPPTTLSTSVKDVINV